MGVTAAVAFVAVAGAAYQSNSAAHAATNAHTAAAEQEQQVNNQIVEAHKQELDDQSQSQDRAASATAAAQARTRAAVRSVSNPDGQTIMTSPLGAAGPQAQAQSGAASLSAPPPAPGLTTTQGKTTIGA